MSGWLIVEADEHALRFYYTFQVRAHQLTGCAQLMRRACEASLSENERVDYVMFIRECVGLKNLQSAVRAACYKVGELAMVCGS